MTVVVGRFEIRYSDMLKRWCIFNRNSHVAIDQFNCYSTAINHARKKEARLNELRND